LYREAHLSCNALDLPFNAFPFLSTALLFSTHGLQAGECMVPAQHAPRHELMLYYNDNTNDPYLCSISSVETISRGWRSSSDVGNMSLDRKNLSEDGHMEEQGH
jgi:hypothetical protein